MNYSQNPRAEKERPGARAPDVRADQRGGTRSSASVHTLHSFGRKGDEMEIRRPPIGVRIIRGFTRFVVTLLIGIGGTLAWQSYGDVAREMVAARAPALAVWLPPARLPAVFASTNPPAQPSVAAASFDAMRRSVEQLAARQEQIAQSLTSLWAIEADVRQKMAFTPPAAVTVVPPPPVQQNRPVQPRVR
jgi:hypothetical protein